ncbi:hypothetical protein FISHEDRAFT_72025 [Fistulina hepatica ATCC 64428]|uniref:CCHC-type domain-containing protein n=1 Tax=Fistulina hepatica ATCC 64428 TaxID=1128425 RepID=A0A0D7AIE9_9AGAR|nr:hypothetical protein FISHEDRAFT_72025 [Fistulina hepatica ATCC 64428]
MGSYSVLLGISYASQPSPAASAPAEPKHEDLTKAVSRALAQFVAKQAPQPDLTQTLPLLLSALQMHANQQAQVPGLPNNQALIASLLGAAQAPQIPQAPPGNMYQRPGPQQYGTPQMRNGNCNYCGIRGHYIHGCPEVETDIRAGLCRRNHFHLVVLPSGAHCPKHIPGQTLRERIREYHRLNPNQRADQMEPDRQPNPAIDAVVPPAQGFMMEIAGDELEDHGATIEECEDDEEEAAFQAQLEELSGVQARNIQVKEPIIEAKSKAAGLSRPHIRFMDSVELPARSSKGKGRAHSPDARKPMPPKVVKILKRPAIVQDLPAIVASEPAKPVAATTAKPSSITISAKADKPYYAPPDEQTSGSRFVGPAYHNDAPIEDKAAARKIYEAIMNGTTMIKTKDLLSVAPEVRRQVREDTTTCRINVPIAETAKDTTKASRKSVADDPVVSYYQGHKGEGPPPVKKSKEC